MNDETYIPGPRADYVCTRCEEKGACSAEAPWRDLPVKAARCPSCGAKKFMQRLYSGYTMLVSSDAGKRGIAANEMAGPEFDRQKNKQLAARHARSRPSPMGPVSLVSMGNLGKTVEDTTRGQVRAHQVIGRLPQSAGVGIPGKRVGDLGGVPQPNAPRQWQQRATASDRTAIQNAAGQK